MFLTILSLFVFVHFLIGVYDFSFYRIPNLFLGFLIVLYGFYAPIYLNLHTILTSAGLFGIMLVLGFGLYALKIIGAGDAKYVAVASLWFGISGIVPLLFMISLAGAVVAVIFLVFRDYVGRFSDWVWMKIQTAEASYPQLQNIWISSGAGSEKGKRENIGSRMIPYGIAIATGSIIMMMIKPITH